MSGVARRKMPQSGAITSQQQATLDASTKKQQQQQQPSDDLGAMAIFQKALIFRGNWNKVCLGVCTVEMSQWWRALSHSGFTYPYLFLGTQETFPEFLDVIYWLRQMLALIIGLVWGRAPSLGGPAIMSFVGLVKVEEMRGGRDEGREG